MLNQENHFPNPSIFGVQVTPITINELHQHIGNSIENNQKSLAAYVNAHCLNLAYEEEWLHDFLNSADIVFSDGAGVILAARILGFEIPERITYADWMWQFGEFVSKRGFSLFLLGALPGVADAASKRLKERFPEIQIKGVHHGYFDKTLGSPENEAVIEVINYAKPHILILGFGNPLQEKWLLENWNRIDANVALTGGAVFDYISGVLPRAPHWMTDNGLEWLGRLIIEPRRLWKRYIIGNPIFLWRVFMQKLNLRKFD